MQRLLLVAVAVVAAAIWLLPGRLVAEGVLGLAWVAWAVLIAKLMIWRATHPDDNQRSID